MNNGVRVTATIWGERKSGTVVSQNVPGIVWVLWDGASKWAWVHAASLTIEHATQGTSK